MHNIASHRTSKLSPILIMLIVPNFQLSPIYNLIIPNFIFITLNNGSWMRNAIG